MTVAIRTAIDDEDLATIARIVTVASPEDATTVAELRWADATYPGGKRLLAEVDGVTVGASTVGRIYVYPPEFDGYWGTIDVLPDARRQGVGSALLLAVAAVAREAGKSWLHVPANESRPEGIAFLEHRGFTELERMKALRLDLTGLEPPIPRPPEGVVITTLADRPDLVAGVHAVALETFGDIPGDEPMAAGDLAEFRARDVDRSVLPPWGFAVALDGDDLVVGYASLMLMPGNAHLAWHDMTAVRRAWRGRGLAVALKLTTIAAAIEHGLTVLETGNDIDNAPMRAVNDHLGYRPQPDLLTMRGPVGSARLSGGA
jgi:GNAT superfamily N-acetyltransferase